MLRVVMLLVSFMVLASAGAQAKCLNKAAVATSGTEESAKWFALETMVQSVSWGLWPSFVADGSTPGWRIATQNYRCRQSGASVTCRGQATFCQTAGN